MEAEMQQRIQKLQMIEESLHSYLGQKQQVQAQLMELESASVALGDTKTAYTIIGSIMVERPHAVIKQELGEKIERTKVRLQSLEKQEQKLKDQAEQLQKEIMQQMKR